MTNIKHMKPIGNDKPLNWLARGIEAALRSYHSGDSVMVTIDRADAIALVRMIDEHNGDEGRTG